MISFEIPEKAQALLTELAAFEGKSETEVAFEALMERIEDWRDASIIMSGKRGDGPFVPLAEVKRKLLERGDGGRDAAE